ncbi:hypothetical protein ACOMHN_037160 [Nucella lapillus]
MQPCPQHKYKKKLTTSTPSEQNTPSLEPSAQVQEETDDAPSEQNRTRLPWSPQHKFKKKLTTSAPSEQNRTRLPWSPQHTFKKKLTTSAPSEQNTPSLEPSAQVQEETDDQCPIRTQHAFLGALSTSSRRN